MRLGILAALAAAACGGHSANDGGTDGATCVPPPGAHGVLDPCFGVNGIATVPVTAPGVTSLLVTPDGKLVVVGTEGYQTSQPVIVAARLDAGGELEPGFASGPVPAMIPDSSRNHPNAAALAADGSLVIGGSTGGGDISVLRFMSAGQFDASFGNAGIAAIPGATTGALVVQPLSSGGAVAGGPSDATSTSTTMSFAQFTPTGSLDASFGSGGTLADMVPQVFHPLRAAIAADGTLVFAGQMPASGSAGDNLTVIRYTASYGRDMTFGSSGIASFGAIAAAGATTFASSIGITSAGRIVVSGCAAQQAVVAALAPGGSVDASYATGGVLQSSFGHDAACVAAAALLLDGTLVLAGSLVDSSTRSAALFRVDPTGHPDPSLGTDGSGALEVALPPVAGAQPAFEAIAVDSQGRYVLAGVDGDSWIVARYLP